MTMTTNITALPNATVRHCSQGDWVVQGDDKGMTEQPGDGNDG